MVAFWGIFLNFVAEKSKTVKEIVLNAHNKHEYPPMHTAEHLLNRAMVNHFGCSRSGNAHIERKKSKMSFILPQCPAPEEVEGIVSEVNKVIAEDVPVNYSYEAVENLEEGISLEKLPQNASNTIRIVKVGNYDKCACIGLHVEHTAQIGKLVLLGTNWDEEKKSFRIRFKLEGSSWQP